MIAGEVSRLREDLATFCGESRLPVVFSDLEPFPTESEYPANTAFIGYDTGELGELAGDWLVKHLRGRTEPRCSSSPVSGIDGVPEARTLIDTADSPFRATVVQDTHRLAVGAVDLLVKMHRGYAVPQRTILKAEIYEGDSARL